MEILNPKKHLDHYSKIYPGLWKHIDFIRNQNQKNIYWPGWCFFPHSDAIYSFITGRKNYKQEIDDKEIYAINEMGILGALATWRVTQGIYRFHPDIYEAIIKTPLTGNLPHDVLFNLPEWCIYIETPGLSFLDLPLAGFFAYMMYDCEQGRKKVCMVLDHTFQEHDRSRLMHMSIPLGPWSLKDSIEAAITNSEQVLGEESDLSPLSTPEALQHIKDNLVGI